MFRIYIIIVWVCLFGGIAGPNAWNASAQDTTNAPTNEFVMSTGDILKGEIASANEDGLVVRLNIGGFSDRVSWTKFTQETLQQLVKNPQAQKFAEPFLDVPLDLKPKTAPVKKAFTPKPVERIELPPAKGDFMAVITAPATMAILALLCLANLFAAYEVAIFRGRPVPLVCGISALLPIVGPLIFLSLPSLHDYSASAEPAHPSAEASAEHGAPSPAGGSGALSMNKGGKAAPTALQPVTYARNDTNFDRRFFETKFPGYFRVVLGEAEKEMVIVIKTVKDEHIGRRFTRITGNEIHIQLAHGGNADVGIAFSEITQVQLRHKDGK
jgi:hypothetical protein